MSNLHAQKLFVFFFFFFHYTATTEIYTLSLHDALPICEDADIAAAARVCARTGYSNSGQSCISVRSEEHTSELQSRFDLVCRLLLEKKKNKTEPLPPFLKTNAHNNQT